MTGGYAIVNDQFVFSTTIAGLKSVIDAVTGKTPTLPDTAFSTDTKGAELFAQPELLVPELKRFLPLTTLLFSLSGQELDATLTQRIIENLFPLEFLGPISAEMNFSEGAHRCGGSDCFREVNHTV